MAEQRVSVTLTLQQFEQVLVGLSVHPYRDVAPLIEHLQREADASLQQPPPPAVVDDVSASC